MKSYPESQARRDILKLKYFDNGTCLGNFSIIAVSKKKRDAPVLRALITTSEVVLEKWSGNSGVAETGNFLAGIISGFLS